MTGRDGGLVPCLDDLFGPTGFRPGLRPRAHLGIADLKASSGESEEGAIPAVGEDPAEVEERLQQLAWEALSRQREAESAGEIDGESGAAGAEAPGSGDADPAHTLAEAREVDDPGGPGQCREPDGAAPCLRVDPRLGEARRGLAAFPVRNVYQRELKAMLTAMVDHMAEAFTTPEWEGELERWWVLFAAFRRCLDFQEMAGRRARTVFRKLIKMKAETVIAVADQGGMGRRIRRQAEGEKRCVER